MKMYFRLLFCAGFFLSCNAAAGEYLRLATTTSTENTGLLSVLNPPFEQANDVKVHVIAVGTGKALRLGQDGDVDVVFVHAPEAEKKFMDAKYGLQRQPVMHNDFVLLGPPSDPAGVRESRSLSDAFHRIFRSQCTFISRGDDSGTHKKEMQLWNAAGLDPGGDWYLSVGQGMGQVLQIANESLGYTLSDRGTWLAYRDKSELQIAYEGAAELANPYHVIVINPERHPHVRSELAQAYVDYLISEQGQSIIRNFRVNGGQLFYPDVIP